MALFEEDDRTEPPTPRKREEARERGQVARSQDLAAALVLLFAFVGLELGGASALRSLGGAMAGGLLSLGSSSVEGPAAGAVTRALSGGAGVLLPLMVLCLLIAAGVNLLQVGFLFSGQAVAPDAARLDPVRGAARMLSPRSLLRGASGLLKAGAVGGVLVFTLRNELGEPGSPAALALLGAPISEAAAAALLLAARMGLRASAVLLALGVLDLWLQRRLHERDLRMTRREVREELRRMEGDPRTRERRRRIREELLRDRSAREVARASLVVVGAGSLAVAIRHDGSLAAPVITARGKGRLGRRIRAVALGSGVAVVERRGLCRALFRAAEKAAEVPAHLYGPVAEVLAGLGPSLRGPSLRGPSLRGPFLRAAARPGGGIPGGGGALEAAGAVGAVT